MRKDKRLRIAITVDPEIPVPPRLYGGIERVAEMLVRGLAERGHEVTLFAHRDSCVPCRLVPYRWGQSQRRSHTLRNARRVCLEVWRMKPDVIHSFARLAYLAPLMPLGIPTLMSYQRGISPRSVQLGDWLSRGSLHYVGCSGALIAPWAGRPNWHVVYNGAPLQVYDFHARAEPDAPLVFLGRVQEIKGAHLAIEVARKSGRRLVIAGNVPDDQPEHRKYFHEQVEPHVDGRNVQYVGPVDDRQKNELLGSAWAFLMPILWEEPFGIVMAEALACGTPVIGLRRGSVPEVVQDGVNGWACGSVEEMAQRVAQAGQIDRAACRRVMEEKFSDRAMVEAYESLYLHLRSQSTSPKS